MGASYMCFCGKEAPGRQTTKSPGLPVARQTNKERGYLVKAVALAALAYTTPWRTLATSWSGCDDDYGDYEDDVDCEDDFFWLLQLADVGIYSTCSARFVDYKALVGVHCHGQHLGRSEQTKTTTTTSTGKWQAQDSSSPSTSSSSSPLDWRPPDEQSFSISVASRQPVELPPASQAGPAMLIWRRACSITGSWAAKGQPVVVCLLGSPSGDLLRHQRERPTRATRRATCVVR